MATMTLDELVAHIPDGCLLAVPPDYSGVAMAATRALIRREPRDLRVLCVPVGSIQVDQLSGDAGGIWPSTAFQCSSARRHRDD
jgi:glutaconate CoA-transferase subunit A